MTNNLVVTIAGQSFEVALEPLVGGNHRVVAKVGDRPVEIIIPTLDGPLEDIEWAIVDGRPYEISFDRELHWIRSYQGVYTLAIRDQATANGAPRSRDGRVKAPIPGKITRIFIQEGAEVQAGEPLLILEAMKMENEIRAPRDGVAGPIQVEPGEGVATGQVLVEIA
jgi:acetyl/propionyl-CoA carboxylase alpha subunit